MEPKIYRTIWLLEKLQPILEVDTKRADEGVAQTARVHGQIFLLPHISIRGLEQSLEGARIKKLFSASDIRLKSHQP